MSNHPKQEKPPRASRLPRTPSAAHDLSRGLIGATIRGVTGDEQIALCVAAKAGDTRARERLIACNLPFVKKIALRYLGFCRHLTIDDLMSEGAMGIARAIETFEPERGFKFLTYAGPWIRQCIQRAMFDTDSEIRMPVHVLEVAVSRRFKDARARLRASGKSHDEVVAELAREFDMTPDRIENAISGASNRRIASLDAEFGDDEDGNLYSVLPSNDVSPVDRMTIEQRRLAIRAAVADVRATLSRRDAAILDARLYVDEDDEDETLRELGDRFGLSRERIRQVEAVLRDRLRKRLSAFAKGAEDEDEKKPKRRPFVGAPLPAAAVSQDPPPKAKATRKRARTPVARDPVVRHVPIPVPKVIRATIPPHLSDAESLFEVYDGMEKPKKPPVRIVRQRDDDEGAAE